MTDTSAHFIAGGLPTLIGSLPLSNYSEALDWIYASTPDIPLWPQLPSNPKERMLNQFIEGLPGIVEENDSLYFDVETESFAEEQLAFYEDYLLTSEDLTQLPASRFQTSAERAAGIYRLKEKINAEGKIRAIKAQITGPFTMLTGICDQNKKIGYYDPGFRDVIVKGVAMKAAWQVQFFKELSYPVLLFIDEPALAGLGSSAFISISLEDIAQDLDEVTVAIHSVGGLAGVHVCANTDWTLLLSSRLDIISFDAHGFFDRFITCKDQIESFLDRGGIIAWGIVPTSEVEHILAETAESLAKRWEEQAQMLVSSARSLQDILNQTLITPSCGTGSLKPDIAQKVLDLTKDVSALLRNKIFGTANG